MLNQLIQWSLSNRAIVIAAALILMVTGLRTASQLPIEVLPDLTKPTVIVLTEAPGLAPEEVEMRVTQPLENALAGVAGITRLRSNSDIALSLVYAEFDWETDIGPARTLIQERLQSAREHLPPGVQPFMTPVASLMGEILLVGVRSTLKEGEEGYLPPRDIRTLADWTIKRRLQSIPGVAEVLNMGGGVKQVEIQPDPAKLQAYGISFTDLENAARNSASSTTGGFLSTGSTEIMVRHLAMTADLDEIARTVIRHVNDTAITIGDVARVEWGVEPMRGDATISLSPETTPTYGVIMSVTKTPGFDTRQLTAEIHAALKELAPTLPPGVETIPLFQQKEFIDLAIGNLMEAIRDGAVMVALVLFLFLLNTRTTFITLMAIPLSFTITMLVFRWMGTSVNSMTLGGLAVAIGMVVDDAIVDVENVYRRLRENASAAEPRPVIPIIAEASGEVRHSILYATLLIIMVFLPLLGLTGVEGKLFAPMAYATIISMTASFIVSLTVIPVLCSFLLKPKPGEQHRDGLLVRWMKGLLNRTFLRAALNQPLLTLASALALFLAALSLYPAMKRDFLPKFQEETLLVAATAAPGTSLEEMNRLSDILEEQLLAVPEVHKVGRRLGRAERGDHVVPLSSVEFDVDFRKPDAAAPASSTRSREAIEADIKARLDAVPGIFAVLSGPLSDRIGHMMSGVSAPIAIKIFGPELEKLQQIARQIQGIAATIPGLDGARPEQQASIPQLRIEADRQRALAYGVTPGALNDELAALIGGKEVAEIREGERTLKLVARLPLEWRDSPEKISTLPFDTPSGARLPLSMLADIHEATGPNVILREQGQRRLALAIKPTAGNAATLVAQLQRKVDEQLRLPEGYFLSYEGDFQARAEATQRIALFSAIIGIAIFLILARTFQSSVLALQVLVNIPLALIGGLTFAYLKLNNINMATIIGFIAVAGVAARNGIMMISHYLHLMAKEGESFSQAMIIRGTQERLVPVLMTALAAGIGLIPLVLAGGEPGKEILHPVAVVIVGGLISSTLLDMAVTPAMFWLFGRKAAEQAIRRGATAAR